ncbi:MAG TPA: polysaccharide biosynthesis C-terminal domain-containing protein [Pyrinomonadaceae bacterium]|nr:polysaccharide biosynthesis C-terminal domain-containing protein [Pyrinomonadaceae bacterium]
MNLSASKIENASNLARNMAWMVWSGVVSIANSILLWIFIARLRDVEELGRFTIVMGLYALFFTVCSLGLMPYMTSEISRRSDSEKFVGSASIFLTISGFVCAILMTAVGFFVSESDSVRISTAILSLAMLPTGLISVAEAAAIAHGRTRLIAFVTTVENLLRTIIPLGLLYAGFDISIISASFVAVRFAALAIYFVAASEFFAKFSFDKFEFGKILKVTPTFAGTIIFAAINWQAAVILLGRISTETEAAKFGAASRFLIPVTILMASYASVIQPALARFTKEDSGAYLAKMARYPLVLATFAALLSPFLSRFVLTFLFGEKYADVAPVLDILAVSVVPFCVVMIAARGLVAANAPHIDLLANALGVLVTFAVGFWLIPAYGAKGAALAQLVSFLLMALVEVVYLSKKTNSFKIWRTASISSIFLFATYIIIWN